MKCSLKDGFINILFIVFIAPSEGSEFPLFLRRSSVLDKPMNLHQFRASINRLQDLDSFPGFGENRMHRIVKKQMTGSDFKDARRNKRAVASSLETPRRFARGGAGDGTDFNSKDSEKAERAVNKSEILKARSAGEATTNRSFLKWLKDFARGKDSLFQKETKKGITPKTEGRSYPGREEDQIRQGVQQNNQVVKEETIKQNPCLCTEIRRVPDRHDFRYYYECESNPNGCLKLRHMRCPKGQFFSYKYLKCLRANRKRTPSFRQKKSAFLYNFSKGPELYDLNSAEDQEPSNEWLDVNQGLGQKIPSEFKPKKKPDLKIYHLRVKRTPDRRLRKEVQGVNQERAKLDVTRVDGFPVSDNSFRGLSKMREIKRHHPRSYVIRVKKKEGKYDPITDSNENDNDNDEDDDEVDEEEDDDETDDEDEDGEGDDSKEVTEEISHKETLKDLLKSAKEAVTNRARFEDPTQIAPRAIKLEAKHSSLNGKKSDDSTQMDKKVLIDANIKVDSTMGSVLRSFLKSKKKDLELKNKAEGNEAFVSDRESQDKLDPELLRTYENLMRNNPRVKRYFLVNCSARRN